MASKHFSLSLLLGTSILCDRVMPKFTICNGFRRGLILCTMDQEWLSISSSAINVLIYDIHTSLEKVNRLHSISNSMTVSQLPELSKDLAPGHEANLELEFHDFSIVNKFWHNLNYFKYPFLQILSIGVIKTIKFSIWR